MSAIMISIRPEWCEKIARGKKTVEVRKTKPKLETPFKCYIYCTKPSKRTQTICGAQVINTDELYRLPNGEIKHGYSGELMCYPSEQWNENNFMNGKVIGEFVCDMIYDFCFECSDWTAINPMDIPFTNMTDRQIAEYLGNGKPGYGWHISDRVIYDNPLEIVAFDLTRPPQSWCYVMEV